MVGLEKLGSREFEMILQDPLKHERTILSTIILHSVDMPEVEVKRSFRLDEKYFSSPFHKDLVRIISYFQKKDIAFDEHITASYLKHYNRFNEVAFLDVIATVEVPYSVMVQHYEMLKSHYDSFSCFRIAV